MANKIPDMTDLTVLGGLFTGAQVSGYIYEHAETLVPWVKPPGATIAEQQINAVAVVDMYLQNGPQNAHGADVIARALGFPAPWVRQVIAEFDAAVIDVANQEGLI